MCQQAKRIHGEVVLVMKHKIVTWLACALYAKMRHKKKVEHVRGYNFCVD